MGRYKGRRNPESALGATGNPAHAQAPASALAITSSRIKEPSESTVPKRNSGLLNRLRTDAALSSRVSAGGGGSLFGIQHDLPDAPEWLVKTGLGFPACHGRHPTGLAPRQLGSEALLQLILAVSRNPVGTSAHLMRALPATRGGAWQAGPVAHNQGAAAWHRREQKQDGAGPQSHVGEHGRWHTRNNQQQQLEPALWSPASSAA